MQYKIQEIKEITAATGDLIDPVASVAYLATDSRKISFAATALFFALKTQSRDGMAFLEEVYQQGVRNFIVHRPVDQSRYPDANFLLVEDPLLALQQLAGFHRRRFNYPVIGITGSNGKTIVKEWLYSFLAGDFKVVRSPRSFNSQIGVPLSVWEMDEEDDLGIFEAGISMTGEMWHLQQVIQPTIGVLTNIGDAHREGFDSKQGKLLEKLKLFENAAVLFFSSDNGWVDAAVNKHFKDTNTKLYRIGTNEDAFLQIVAIRKDQENSVTCIETQCEGLKATVKIPFTDEAAIQNVLTCWAVCRYLGIGGGTIAKVALELPAIDMRLQVVPAINRCTVINDSYSLDTESLKVGLDLLHQQLLTKTLILSDIAGLDSGHQDEVYQAMAALVTNKQVNRLITIGIQWKRYAACFKLPEVEQYDSTENFVLHFQPGRFKDEAILLKGARKFHFEDIFGLLMEKVHQTRLEVNLSAIVHNLKVYRQQILPTTKLMAMVKAFAYGSGIIEIASVLQYHKIDYLAVAYADEGVALRNAGIHVPLMVMNVDTYGFETIVQHQLEPEIYSFRILAQMTGFLKKQGLSQYPVHIKIDTGMHRLGFELQEIDALVAILKLEPTIHVKSVFSHFTSSEDSADDGFTKKQAEAFHEACEMIYEAIGYGFIRHIANSAGIARFSQYQLDMVRLGVGLYGINTTDKELPLRTVATLKATIAQIKHIAVGDTVGYNRKGKINRPTTTATIRIGYADGFSRLLGNGNGSVLIRGKRAPVIGNVCMDMTMVDITEIAEAKEGDDVEIFGEHLPVQLLAKASATSSYEIFTSVGQRVNRVYLED